MFMLLALVTRCSVGFWNGTSLCTETETISRPIFLKNSSPIR